MSLRAVILTFGLAVYSGSAFAMGLHPGIQAFADHCFKKGMMPHEAKARMKPEAGGFELVFWDTSLLSYNEAPPEIERRCSVTFEGDFADIAVQALKLKMETPPHFGQATNLPYTHEIWPRTVFMEARQLLKGRVAVVSVWRLYGPRTRITVDRLPEAIAPGIKDDATSAAKGGKK